MSSNSNDTVSGAFHYSARGDTNSYWHKEKVGRGYSLTSSNIIDSSASENRVYSNQGKVSNTQPLSGNKMFSDESSNDLSVKNKIIRKDTFSNRAHDTQEYRTDGQASSNENKTGFLSSKKLPYRSVAHTGTRSCPCGGNCSFQPGDSNYSGNDELYQYSNSSVHEKRKQYELRSRSDAGSFARYNSSLRGNGFEPLDSNGFKSKRKWRNDDIKEISPGVFSLDGLKLTEDEVQFLMDTSLPPDIKGHKESGVSGSASASSGKAHQAVVPSQTPRQIKFRKNPNSEQEKLLSLHTREFFQNNNAKEPAADCSICLSDVTEESEYNSSACHARDIVGCVSMTQCGHVFHTSCLHQLAGASNNCLSCPNCNTMHGVRLGDQPLGGRMTVTRTRSSLPGHLGHGTIVVSYSFPHGTQGPNNPNPGRPYHLVGFPRVGYLPDSPKGNKALKLLQVAFDRRLTFTVGTSVTTGSHDNVVWNGVHHKTETGNYGGHGYPDPNYLDNVMLELASLGVTEDQ